MYIKINNKLNMWGSELGGNHRTSKLSTGEEVGYLIPPYHPCVVLDTIQLLDDDDINAYINRKVCCDKDIAKLYNASKKLKSYLKYNNKKEMNDA